MSKQGVVYRTLVMGWVAAKFKGRDSITWIKTVSDCNLQFADFSEHQEQFKQADIGVVALSVDKEEDARKMVEGHKVTFPIIYGLDVRKEAEKIGAYFDSENSYFQPANFILRNGKVIQATYSSGPLGRLQAEHVLMFIDHYRKPEEKDDEAREA